LLVLGIATSVLAAWLSHGVSRRRNLARELATLQATLAGKDRFLAGVSHELRTPLTAVVGNLELLAHQTIPMTQAERDRLVIDALDSAAELERLVDDHLTAARLSAGALTIRSEVVDLDPLVTRILDGLSLPPRLKVTCGALGSCLGDGLRVRQIVRNILRNAGRYASSEIEIRRRPGDERVIVDILNDGVPVSPSMADRLFQPFTGETVPGQPESIGLGLSVSRDLARRMGGDLDYTYSGDRACFSLELPTVAETNGNQGSLGRDFAVNR
jgi:signal transduction histidine kinase